MFGGNAQRSLCDFTQLVYDGNDAIMFNSFVGIDNNGGPLGCAHQIADARLQTYQVTEYVIRRLRPRPPL